MGGFPLRRHRMQRQANRLFLCIPAQPQAGIVHITELFPAIRTIVFQPLKLRREFHLLHQVQVAVQLHDPIPGKDQHPVPIAGDLRPEQPDGLRMRLELGLSGPHRRCAD